MLGPDDRLAIIGLAGRFAGAPTVDALAAMLESGRTGISFFSDAELRAAGIPASLLDDPCYVKARFALEGAELFDAGFFSLTPREAERLDPQQRLFLEQCWAALEDAGHASEKRPRRVGIFASASRSTYQTHLLRCLGEEALLPFALDGTLNDFMASRAAHALDLRGPSLMVQTACSSSLHALHLACQSLLTGESDLALVGASSITVPTRAGALFQEGGLTSPDGHCRAFDAEAKGTVGGDAVVVLVVKRLEDALRDRDHVRALILGSAVNNDGAARAGFTAPAVDGQAEVIAQALRMAGVSPGEIGYVEAHGSGTPLGDPIEIAALSRAFSSAVPRQSCPVGSIKPSVGHTDVAAGLAGLVKVVLGLEKRTLFPTAHFQRPNPHIDFPQTPFFVQTELAPWPSRAGSRKAGVSSFGMGGSNAHVVLEEAPPPPERGPEPPWKLLPLSARSRPALAQITAQLAAHLRAHPTLSLTDVAHTLQVGRSAFAHRQTLLCRTREEAALALESGDPRALLTATTTGAAPSLALLFSGLGDSSLALASSLAAQAPAFRAELDRCAEHLTPLLSLDLRTLLPPPTSTLPPAPNPLRPPTAPPAGPTPLLQQTRFAHPLLLSIELSLLALLRALGLAPAALLGHSLGEYASAVAAGIFTREEALSLVAERALLISTLPRGAMLALPLSAEEIAAIAAPGISLAAVNGARMSVVGGSEEAIAAFAQTLSARGLASMRLPVEHAFHTEAMRPIAAAFAARVAEIPARPPQIPCLSSLSGDWLSPTQALQPEYWVEQLCQPVRFHEALTKLLDVPSRVLVELGPGATLTSLARLAQAERGAPAQAIGVLAAEPGSDGPPWLAALASLFRAGFSLDWEALAPESRARRVPLPTYPFERARHWVDGPLLPFTAAPAPTPRLDAGDTGDQADPPPTARSALPRSPREAALLGAFQQAFGLERIGIFDSFFSLGGHSLLAIQLLHRIRRSTGLSFTVRQLVEHPTVAALAALSLDAPEGNDSPPLREQLTHADEAARRALVQSYLVDQLSRALGRSPAEVEASDDLRALDLAHNLADLVVAVKRDLGRPVYAHELLARPTVAGLTELLLHLEQPSAPLASAPRPAVSASAPAPSPREKNPPAAFLLSSARSGSTLLRVMLAGHPQLFSPPELHLLMYASMREREAGLPSAHFGSGLPRALMELLDRDLPRAEAEVRQLLADDVAIPEVYRRLQSLCHPRLLVDKSPSYAEQMATLRRAPSIFEGVIFLHLVRHPLAVIESYVRNRIGSMSKQPGADPWQAGEEHWLRCNRNIVDFLAESGQHAHLLRFEDLVADPGPTMDRVAAALGVPSCPELLRPYDGGRMIDGVGDPNLHEHERIEPALGEAWKTIVPPRPLGAEARALAERLGYDPLREA
jgi:acyl transferase domain-containing protein